MHFDNYALATDHDKAHSGGMEENRRSSRIVSLKREISLFKQESQRLRWIVSSHLTPENVRPVANRDLNSLSESLRKAEIELSRLEESDKRV